MRLSATDHTECMVLIPGNPVNEEGRFNPDSLRTVKGYVEDYANKLKEHEIVQFERFGYCILDNKESMQFVFTSE